MSDAVKLVLPAEPPYPALVSEVAAKYLELLGAATADARALADALVTALAPVGDRPDHADITAEFAVTAGDVRVSLRCADWSAVVTQPLPVRKS